MVDTELMRLANERVRKLTELARLLKYAGPNHPNRAKENKRRSVHRKRVKKELKDNGLAICARVMEMCATERTILENTRGAHGKRIEKATRN